MTLHYKKLGPIEYRRGRYQDPEVRALRLRTAHEYVYVWRDANSAEDEPMRGIGYPVLGRDGSVVNFLKIRPTGSSFEESLISGFPIAQGKVIFGEKPTKEILVAIDCITALILHIATGLGTVAVLYEDNLLDECRNLKTRHPDNLFKVCVNCQEDEDSRELFDAREAALAINAVVIISGRSSFSDLFRSEGSEGVRQRLENACTTQPWRGRRVTTLGPLRIPFESIAWPHRFEGINLVDNLVAAIQRHVVIPEYMAFIVSVWVIHTHVIEAARFSPALIVGGAPEYATGKSTLLMLLSRLCRYAYKTAQIWPAHLLRLIAASATMLFEDGDSMFRSQQYLTILNVSHDRWSNGVTTADKKDQLHATSTFFAKAIKAHGVPESLRDRSIPIQLERKRPDETIAPLSDYSPDLNDDLTALQAQIIRWAQDHMSELKMAPSVLLDLGSDRLNDTFSPLVSIANIIGGDIPQRLAAAARQLYAREDLQSEGRALLMNIRQVLLEKSVKKIHSSDLVEALCARSDWPWGKCNKGGALDQSLLADMLREYGIAPKPVRLAVVKQGYWAADFRQAFARYAPGAEQNVDTASSSPENVPDSSASTDSEPDES